MDGPQEYEVESVTRARVYDKRGKKITWKYYVKWKGYGWDECTWEPRDSFQGSEHIVESFWDRVDTGGRDISDATAFKKGEELVVSGPPGKKLQKRKANSLKTLASSSFKEASGSNGATISAPLLSPRKRRRVQPTASDERGYSKLQHRVSTGGSRNGQISSRPPKRRRASSPGPRKSTQKRLPSPGDSQLDADGETDPDVAEVEDELMQESTGVAEEDTETQRPDTASGIPDGSKEITFDDLEHFYSGNPIDIDQNAEERMVDQKPEAPASPATDSYDPLFDSPPHPSDKALEVSILPHHRARAAKPLVKLIDATKLESTNKQAWITAKARLMSLHTTDVSSAGGSKGNVAKRGGSGRFSSRLISRNRSSLLTATKGSLKSVKGKFGNTIEHDQRDEIEEVPSAGEGETLHVTSWSDEDVTDRDHQTTSNSRPAAIPSGDELLKLAGLRADPEALPDYEDDGIVQLPETEEVQTLDVASAPADEQLNLADVGEESKPSDHTMDTSSSMSEVQQQVATSTIDSPPVVSDTAPSADDAVKKNIALAKEQLFPSTQAPFDSFSGAQSSFCSTIFGPLYQGSAVNCEPIARNESSTTFKVTLGDGVELPLVLKDTSKIMRISDILIGNSSGSRIALFYCAEDALTMVSTLKSDSTARVVLDPSAGAVQEDRFTTFMQRFQSFHTLIAPVGREVCVLYSSENVDIAEKLGAPTHLRGLSSALLISYASIEDQLAYAGAAMKATTL